MSGPYLHFENSYHSRALNSHSYLRAAVGTFLLHDISMMDMLVFRPHNIMQTFLKMSSVVYSMAGLGSVEESKVYKDNFEDKEDPDSLKEEMRDEFNPKDQQQEVRTLSFLLP